MARRENQAATPAEELLLWWYFAKNARSIRRRPKYFQRMLDQQRKIKEFLGWPYRKQTDDERLAELRKIFADVLERFAFDGDLDRPIAPGDEDEGTYDVPDYMR